MNKGVSFPSLHFSAAPRGAPHGRRPEEEKKGKSRPKVAFRGLSLSAKRARACYELEETS